MGTGTLLQSLVSVQGKSKRGKRNDYGLRILLTRTMSAATNNHMYVHASIPAWLSLHDYHTCMYMLIFTAWLPLYDYYTCMYMCVYMPTFIAWLLLYI